MRQLMWALLVVGEHSHAVLYERLIRYAVNWSEQVEANSLAAISLALSASWATASTDSAPVELSSRLAERSKTFPVCFLPFKTEMELNCLRE